LERAQEIDDDLMTSQIDPTTIERQEIEKDDRRGRKVI
jgi:hypothetical protein